MNRPDRGAVRARLPAALREPWDRLALLDAQLGAALQAEDITLLEGLAERRQSELAAFCSAFPLEPATAELRSSALRLLLSGNQELATAGRVALEAAAGFAATAHHHRKAISAYNANES